MIACPVDFFEYKHLLNDAKAETNNDVLRILIFILQNNTTDLISYLQNYTLCIIV